MTIENISLFQGMNAKMNFLAARQKVISQNVANADTADYIAQDLAKPDFSKLLANIGGSHGARMNISMDATSSGHLLPSNQSVAPREQDHKTPYEVKPDGNGVVLEEQMIKSNDVQMNYNLMLNLYKSNVDMIRTSLGKKQ